MNRRRRVNPHHVISDADDADVKELIVKCNMKQLEVFSPAATLDEIKEQVKDHHGPGKYTITANDVMDKQLRGYRTFEIRDSEERAIGNFSTVMPQTSPMMTDSFWSERERSLREEMDRIEKGRIRLETDRERYVDEILHVKQTSQTSERTMLEKFMAEQSRLQAETETRRLELDKQHRHDEAERQRAQQVKLAELENRRLELEAKVAEVAETKYRLEVEHERKLFELKFEQMQEASNRQREMDRQAVEIERKKMELEQQKREHEMDRKYGLSSESGVPTEVLAEIAWRRMEEEFPQKSDIEKILEKYINPVLEYLKHSPEIQKRLAGGVGGRVSSPQTPPSAAPNREDDEVVFSSDD